MWLGIVLGILNSWLMASFFFLGMYAQRKWNSAEINATARKMVDDMIYMVNTKHN